MPRISAASNAAQRENTKRAILDSFGRLLYERGLPGLTMTHVAKTAGIGRTAVYNYFADMGELLIAYALDETGRFLTDLRSALEGVENPIDRLAIYVRLQIEDLSRRHMPPVPPCVRFSPLKLSPNWVTTCASYRWSWQTFFRQPSSRVTCPRMIFES